MSFLEYLRDKGIIKKNQIIILNKRIKNKRTKKIKTAEENRQTNIKPKNGTEEW